MPFPMNAIDTIAWCNRLIFHKDHNKPSDQQTHPKMICDRSKCDRQRKGNATVVILINDHCN